MIEIAKSWLGTPYISHAQVKGCGVDCARLIEAIFNEAGLVENVKFPDYKTGNEDHINDNLIEPILLDLGFKIRANTPQPKDIVVFKIARVPFHMGLMISENSFIHAIRDAGVIESRIDDSTYSKRFQKAYYLP